MAAMRRLDPALLVVLGGVSAALHVGKLPPALPVLQQALGVTLLEAGFLLSLVQLAGMSLGLAVDYLKYIRAGTSRVRPYLGGGVGMTRTSNNALPAAATGATITETRNAPGGIPVAGFAAPGMTLDLHANLGAEFFLFNEVSIAGEYSLNVVNRTSPANMQAITAGNTVITRGNPTTNILGFGAAGATVRIYF